MNRCMVAMLRRYTGPSEIGRILQGRETRVQGRDPRRSRLRDSRRGFDVELLNPGGPDFPGRWLLRG